MSSSGAPEEEIGSKNAFMKIFGLGKHRFKTCEESTACNAPPPPGQHQLFTFSGDTLCGHSHEDVDALFNMFLFLPARLRCTMQPAVGRPAQPDLARNASEEEVIFNLLHQLEFLERTGGDADILQLLEESVPPLWPTWMRR